LDDFSETRDSASDLLVNRLLDCLELGLALFRALLGLLVSPLKQLGFLVDAFLEARDALFLMVQARAPVVQLVLQRAERGFLAAQRLFLLFQELVLVGELFLPAFELLELLRDGLLAANVLGTALLDVVLERMQFRARHHDVLHDCGVLLFKARALGLELLGALLPACND